MRKVALSLAVLLALGLASRSVAATLEYHVDPVHSEVGFKVKHLVSKTPGRFDQYDGKLWLDPADIAGTLKLSAVIQVASVDTRNEKRDQHLQSADFFDAANNPQITFESTSVKKQGEDFAVAGNLTMRGVTRPVTLTASVNGTGTNPWSGQPMIGLDLTGAVNRKDYGINWNKALDNGGFVLGDDVMIEVHLEASVPKAES